MLDLHMHSCYSEDGEYSPEQLVNQCALLGMNMISVTDHNSVHANAAARAAAGMFGITCISGIEIDCTQDHVNFHVLGYGMDDRSEDFAGIEQNLRDQCMHASLERLEKMQILGFHVTEDELWSKSKDNYWKEMWTGELFAEVLLAKPEYRDHPLLLPYRPGGSRSDNPYVNFYWDYCSQGKLCYVRMEYPSMRQAIDIIHRNGGTAVLAHPGISLRGHEDLLNEILSLGIDGVEAFSSYHTAEQLLEFYMTAKKRGLFVTCGSDYHGKTKPSIHLGEHGSLLSAEELEAQLPEQFFR